MNSYWAEQYARQHLDQLTADARGDRLVIESEALKPAASTMPRLAPWQRARAWVQALPTRRPRSGGADQMNAGTRASRAGGDP